MLYANTLAAGLGVGASLDRGLIGSSAVVRFERQGTRVLLVQPNMAHRASATGAAVVRGVEELFPRSIGTRGERSRVIDGCLASCLFVVLPHQMLEVAALRHELHGISHDDDEQAHGERAAHDRCG